ncbi:MAG: glycosyltransferase [Paracoccaceae bacterium]|nr:MAG: glycosyltransferase [Paracoccaceae bacterium]
MSPDVFIVLPIFRPQPRFLTAQLASVAAQTLPPKCVVFVVADRTSGALVRKAAHAAGLPAEIVEPPQKLDAPRAFEAGLERVLNLAGPEALVAMCDQDDIWHPDRLARGAETLQSTSAALVHSDARLIDAEDRVIHPSMFAFERRHRRPGLRGLLLRNNVTGMTVLMRRSLVERALPFPPQAGVHFYHDLWVALLAEATEGTALIPEALVDYRQHGANAHGAVDRRARALRIGLPGMTWLRREAAAYALARYLAHSVHNRLTDCVQLGQLRHGAARVAPLRPYLRRGPGTLRHWADAARLALTGHLRLAHTAWAQGVVSMGRMVWALREALGPGMNAALDRFDERLFSLSPGALPVVPKSLQPAQAPRPAAAIIDRRKALRFRATADAPAPALQILVPTLNPTEIFAGIATAIDLGLMLAGRGVPVRFVASDLPVGSADASRRLLLGRMTRDDDATGAADRVDFACGVTPETLAFHPEDAILATAWWTAHAADRLIREADLKRRRFLYMIQDYEPNFYAWGPEHAEAEASYGLDFDAVFNTTLLRDYFAMLGHGFATPDAPAFHPAIDIDRYARGTRPDRGGPRRIAVYGRPEVPRNMFPTAVEGLTDFITARGLTPDMVEVLSVGLRHDPVTLANGIVMQSLGKLPFEDYPNWLLGIDMGLSLMHSPHPSHPPIEMAASGARVVTNRFATKDLSRLTPAILSVDGTARGVADGLARAWDMPPVADADRRIDLRALGGPLAEVASRLAPDLPRSSAMKRAAE